MRNKEEIKVLLDHLEAEKERAINMNYFGLALSIASQIETIKWILDKK
jgi:hypothetical protein